MGTVRELPRAAWVWIIRWTAGIIIGSTILSAIISEIIMQTLSQGLNGPGFIASIALPLLLGTPTLLYSLIRQQQLKLANQKLQVLASTDWLTACLNRRAFTHKVSDQLVETTSGAFLVIDADHFKIINDQFGHDHGDEALQLLAGIIQSNLREGDLLGRIGGEEFGVYLMGANRESAHVIAERIRKAVERAAFTPDGVSHPLSVSVGGAAYDTPVSFSHLFRIADQKLYGAKQMGRNRVLFAATGDAIASAAA